MQKRSFKFYRKNEAEVMESLGLKPTKNSGSGWIEKEDGQNDFVICQLKSTDAQSIKVNQKDIRILEKNASVEHKYPMFAIQFLNTNEVWLMVKPENICDIVNYIETGKTNKPTSIFTEIIDQKENEENMKSKMIKSSENARMAFKEEQNKKYNKIRSAK